MRRLGGLLTALSTIALGAATAALPACAPVEQVDATRALERGEVGLPVMSLRWSFKLADRAEDDLPQEFSSPAILLADDPDQDILYVGSHDGTFYALQAGSGHILWKRELGSVSSRPTLDGALMYVGTDDGHVVAIDPRSGAEKWRYATLGPVLESPVVAGDLVIASNEADQVYALDRMSGKFRWVYKSETPEEFTLRGHAGVTASGDLVLTGFSNGSLVALRQATGSVAWLTSLKGDAERFLDVDATPVVVGEMVFAASSAGGVYGIDRATGLVRWRLPVENAGGLATDGKRLYMAAADQGIHAIDLAGNIVWRQGMRGGGEPAGPIIDGDYVWYSLARAGLYVSDRRTGRVLQYFDPGYGVSSPPSLARDRMYIMSNSAILYAMSLRRFD